MSSQIEVIQLFPTFLYAVEKPEFISQVNLVASDLLKSSEQKNSLYPVKMTESMEMDPRLQEFAEFTAITAGNILTDQGYKTDGQGTYFESMWCQEHQKTSSMDQHTHPHTLIVGFFFLNAPINSSIVSFFDPRAGKVATPLEEKNDKELSYASNVFQIQPKPGLLIFANSWLPHAFSRHGSDEPLRFVHFNIGLTEHKNNCTVEII